MIDIQKAVDTNILVRFLVNDNAKQCRKVLLLFNQQYIDKTKLFVSSVVVLEVVWVLSSVYQMPRQDVIDALLQLIDLSILQVEHGNAIADALDQATQHSYDLSDLIIGAVNKNNQCDVTVTFDKKASKIEGFAHL